MHQPLLTIIIVNYNVKGFLDNCLRSVIQAGMQLAIEIIVIDNASSDGSSTFFEQQYPGVQFIWRNSNVGFSTANNEALKMSNGEFILFLNPDTILTEDALLKSVRFLKLNKNAGAIGVRMIDGSGCYLPESKRELPGALASLWRLIGIDHLFHRSKFFSGYYAGHVGENETAEVAVLPGAFMMVRKEVLLKTGSFDADFFMFGEDIDLSYRILQSGFTNYYYPEVTIIHFKGESTQKKSAAYRRHFYGAMHLFVKKHYAFFTAFIMHIAIALSAFLSAVRYFFKRPSQQVFSSATIVIGVQSDFMRMPMADVLFCAAYCEFDGDTDVLIDKLQALLLQHSANQILFCSSQISNQSAVQVMQKMKGVQFLFLQKGSCFIVGSSDKESRGVVISL